MKLHSLLALPPVFFFALVAGPDGPATGPAESSPIIYVNKEVEGGENDGSNWADAYADLQDALSGAQAVDAIWVAQGTYYPTAGEDRTISFAIPNGVAVFAGFDGTETSLGQRDFQSRPTILSGDIGVQNDSTDNTYRVVYFLGADSTTILDGFIVTRGQADHPDWSSPYNKGGGLFIDTNGEYPVCSPTIADCLFVLNTATNGGAVYCEGKDDRRAAPRLRNCTFFKNRATQYGGALHKGGGGLPDMPFIISDCVFEQNKSVFGGGAVYFKDITGVHILSSCSFLKDTSQLDGGAILYEGSVHDGHLEIQNCIFRDNLGVNASGGAVSFIKTSLTPNVTENYFFLIENSWFENNRAKYNLGGAVAIQNYGNDCTLEVRQSIFKNNRSLNGGGAIFIWNGCSDNCLVDLKITDCRFTDNFASIGAAGGIAYRTSGSGMALRAGIANTVFSGNTGALGFLSGIPGSVDASIINCTFYDNGLVPLLKNWSPDFDYVNYYNRFDISNSIFQESVPVGRIFYNNDPSNLTIHDYTVSHCLVSAPHCEVAGVDACGEGMLYEADPLFIDPAAGNFRPAACSPVVNAGNNLHIEAAGIVKDIEGNDRILEGMVDMGAYERLSRPAVAAVVEHASSAGASDGVVAIDTITGGDPPYLILWENGDTSARIENLAPGIYVVSITDSMGCLFSEEFQVDVVNSRQEERRDEPAVQIFPNPADDRVILLFEGPAQGPVTLLVFNAMGQLALKRTFAHAGRHEIGLQGLPAGVYFAQVVMDSGERRGFKLVKR
jgi:predicted outer membrane repeat protein